MMKIFFRLTVMIVAHFCEYTKEYWIIHFTLVNGIECELHLNKAVISEKTERRGASLAVQWLRLCISTAGGTGLIPDWGTRIPHAT